VANDVTRTVASPRAAATVLIVRDGDAGLEVFLVQRHRRSGFLPNAWVFPGGAVEEADRSQAADPSVRGGDALSTAFGLPRVEALAYGLAAVRETREESGIAIGVSDLRAWSWWVTPEAEPRRYDTRFLLAVTSGAEGRHDEVETVASRWISPRAALAAGQSALPLAPPTWWTLTELAAYGSTAAVSAASRPADRAIRPIMSFHEDGMRLALPGHAEHPDPAVPGFPDRITWERDRWVAWRGGERLTDPSPLR
jgi:8-oxo-dGTP pyrophosphatase MutT (NUDIX family)